VLARPASYLLEPLRARAACSAQAPAAAGKSPARVAGPCRPYGTPRRGAPAGNARTAACRSSRCAQPGASAPMSAGSTPPVAVRCSEGEVVWQVFSVSSFGEKFKTRQPAAPQPWRARRQSRVDGQADHRTAAASPQSHWPGPSRPSHRPTSRPVAIGCARHLVAARLPQSHGGLVGSRRRSFPKAASSGQRRPI
jgi:hypothetical protein